MVRDSIHGGGLDGKLNELQEKSTHEMPTFYQCQDKFDSSQKWKGKGLHNQLAVP